MFCPACGTEYNQKTNFCKRCGANMTPATNTVEVHLPRLRTTGMVWAIVAFGTVGLIASMALLSELAIRGLRQEELILPFLFSLLFVSGIAGVLGWQLSRLISTWQQSVQQTIQKAQNELPVPSQAALPQPPSQLALVTPSQAQAVSAVTEHTTRSLHPAAFTSNE